MSDTEEALAVAGNVASDEMVKAIKRYGDALILAERERCARIAEAWDGYGRPFGGAAAGHEIAAAIRAGEDGE